ncbi:MAG TPA: YoaK family protein [Solirubrobacteraceae bacterium]|nr:YoaK family protein [Solirubrobacteraceae bacterium]
MAAALRAALLPGTSDRHGPLVPMMIALTLLTGVVDAVSYLRLGHVFVANMTGNVVFLGFALAGAGGVSIASSLIALGAFLLGARAGGRIGTRLGVHRGHLVRAATAVQATLIAAALAIALASSAPEPDGVRYAITAVLAVAMGIQNALAARIAVPELTTTVLTKTLTGLASEAGRDVAMSVRRVTAVLAMVMGALAGGLLALEVSVAAGLALALALACTVAVAAHVSSRGAPAWTADK